VVRLLRVVAGQDGCLLVLEDLHWADPESLEIFEYLADNIATEPVLCVGTFRTGEAGGALARARKLSARRAATIVDVDRLTDTEVVEMAAACLGEPVLSEQVRDVLRSAADGVPFFVEELLADAAAAVGSTLAVPVSFAETVRRRLREATPEARAVLRVAAVLGRRFEWRLLPDACELVEEAVLAGLTWAVEAQLLAGDQDGEAGGGRFGFRHALTREAVLADVLAPERARLAGPALKAIELAHPGLAGDWCELAADMAEQAGERTRAAQLLLEAGRRSLGLGALATAEAALRRAGWFAADVPALRIDIDEALIEVLALAGRIDQVEDVGTGLLTRLAGQDAGPARRARAHVRLARAAIVASRWDIAEGHLRPVHDLDQNLDPVLLVEADVLGGQLALGQGQSDQARRLAEAALTDSQRIVRPELACEALEVLGRRARQEDLGAAEAAFDQARQIAEQHGITLWRLRALHELGTIDLLGGGPLDRLLMARDGAAAVGALATAVTVDVQIAAWYTNRFRVDEALDAARSCAEVAHRLRLGILEALGLLFQAGAHAMVGRRAEMEAAVTEALGLAGDDPEIAGLRRSSSAPCSGCCAKTERGRWTRWSGA
jgi:hypothetical protein